MSQHLAAGSGRAHEPEETGLDGQNQMKHWHTREVDNDLPSGSAVDQAPTLQQDATVPSTPCHQRQGPPPLLEAVPAAARGRVSVRQL